MIKLPTQFDARARQTLDTAAAGGSTSTCCSSCVVTLGTAVVASSMYLANLRKRAKEGEVDATQTVAPTDAANPWAQPEGVAQPEPIAAEAVVTDSAEPPSETGVLSSAWFWVTAVLLFALLASALGDIGAIVVALAIAMLSLVGWVRLHQRAGVGPVQAIVVGVVALVLILGAIVLEAMAWMGAL